MTNEDKEITTKELSAAMEKMYQEHNAQIVTLSGMITTLARVQGLDPEEFAKSYLDQNAKAEYAKAFNKTLDENSQDINKE